MNTSGAPGAVSARLRKTREEWSPLVIAQVGRWRNPSATAVRARWRKGGKRAGMLGIAVDALSQSDRVWVCGRNSCGQLGLGADAELEESGLKNVLLPIRKTPVGLAPFRGVPIVHVACGALHTIVCSANHAVFAFGYNVHGELGLGHATPSLLSGANSAPQPVPALAGVHVKAIACGPHFTLLATDGDEVLGWGQNDAGQLGLGSPTGHSDDVPRPTSVKGLRGRRVRSLCCGEKHSMVVVSAVPSRRNGRAGRKRGGGGVAATAAGGAAEPTELLAFGGNTYGQLGVEGRTGRLVPTSVPEELFELEGRTAETTLSITHVAAGANFTMVALTAETPTEAEVEQEEAKDGRSAKERAAIAQARADLGVGARRAAAGALPPASVRSTHVYGWGDNQFRQLGLEPDDAAGLAAGAMANRRARRLGDPTHVDRPARSSALSAQGDVAGLACGAMHTLLLTAHGEVWGVGANVLGSMGGGRKIVPGLVRGEPRDLGTARRDTPSPVVKLHSTGDGAPEGIVHVAGIRALWAGAYHCAATTTDGGIFSWGKNVEGQLGLGNNYARYQPGPNFVQGLPTDKVLRSASMCCATEHTVLFVPFGTKPLPTSRAVPDFKDVLEEPKRRAEKIITKNFEPAPAAAKEGDEAAEARGGKGAEVIAEPMPTAPEPMAPEPMAPKAEEKKPMNVIDRKLAGARAKAEAAAKGMNEAQTVALIAERTGVPAPAPTPAMPAGDEFGALEGHEGVFFSPAQSKSY